MCHSFPSASPGLVAGIEWLLGTRCHLKEVKECRPSWAVRCPSLGLFAWIFTFDLCLALVTSFLLWISSWFCCCCLKRNSFFRRPDICSLKRPQTVQKNMKEKVKITVNFMNQKTSLLTSYCLFQLFSIL